MRPGIIRFRELWADRATRAEARAFAVEFVAEHEDELADHFANRTVPELVRLVEVARANGHEDYVTLADMWLVARHGQRHISARVGG